MCLPRLVLRAAVLLLLLLLEGFRISWHHCCSSLTCCGSCWCWLCSATPDATGVGGDGHCTVCCFAVRAAASELAQVRVCVICSGEEEKLLVVGCTEVGKQ